MSCKRSVKTKTGTFTLHEEEVELCEAKLRCMKKGEILAPFANKRDVNKILKLFKSNMGVENCPFVTNAAFTYFVGLDITFNEGKREMVFSNGVKWNDKLHSKLYNDMIVDAQTDCPMAVVQPIFENQPFSLMRDSKDCKLRQKNPYICLKPRRNATAGNIIGSSSADVGNGTQLPTVLFIAILMFSVGAFVGVLAGLKVKNRKCVNEKEKECI